MRDAYMRYMRYMETKFQKSVPAAFFLTSTGKNPPPVLQTGRFTFAPLVSPVVQRKKKNLLLDILGKTLGLVTLAISLSVSAAEYVNMDFTAPEKGGYQTIFGTPSVTSSVGPLNDALRFDAVTSYEQIQIDLPHSVTGYELHYDLYTHNLRDSKYAFTILFDTPQVRTLSFHGGLNQVTLYRPFFSANGPAFQDDQVYRVGMWIDFINNTWTVSLDDVMFDSVAFDATSIDTVRFSLAPWHAIHSDAPGTYVGLDNLTIATIPEPPVWSLLLLVGLPAWFLRRRISHRPA